jgi:hypothetical protein
LTQYIANADYADGAGDIAKARDFRTAIRALMVLQPTEISREGHSRKIAVEQLPKQLEEVTEWLQAREAASGTNQALFTRGRAIL